MTSDPLSTSPTPNTVAVCFQITTKGMAVIDSEPELFPNIETATRRASEWMDLPAGQTLTLMTYEGDGAVVRVEEIEHIAVIPEAKMAELYKTYRYEAQRAQAEMIAAQEQEGTE